MTLLVGYYDYPFGYSARELIEDKLFPVELSDFKFKVLEACDTASYEREYIDFNWLKEYTEDREGEYEKYLDVIGKIFSKYDQVIVCADGCYTLLKIKLEDDNNESVGD